MSIHVCKCEHNGRTEYHLRYPGMTQDEAQALADRINNGELVGAEHPLRKDAERYRWLRSRSYKDGATLAIDVAVIDDVAVGDFGEFIDATADAAIAGVTAVGVA